MSVVLRLCVVMDCVTKIKAPLHCKFFVPLSGTLRARCSFFSRKTNCRRSHNSFCDLSPLVSRPGRKNSVFYFYTRLEMLHILRPITRKPSDHFGRRRVAKAQPDHEETSDHLRPCFRSPVRAQPRRVNSPFRPYVNTSTLQRSTPSTASAGSNAQHSGSKPLQHYTGWFQHTASNLSCRLTATLHHLRETWVVAGGCLSELLCKVCCKRASQATSPYIDVPVTTHLSLSTSRACCAMPHVRCASAMCCDGLRDKNKSAAAL